MITTFTDAIYQATKAELASDPRVHVIGLGATYKNGLDGTMGSLAAEYPSRVHDTPCSENAVTGMAVGMAAMGLKPVVHHGRIEFALYAMDPLLTQAAKWNYMFGGDYPVPLTVRVALGRQWGNGPQHTINNKGLFAIPGIKVVCPSTPNAAYGLLRAAIADYNPVVYLESRWLYKVSGEVDLLGVQNIGRAQVLRRGSDFTVVAVGDTVLEALRAAKMLEGNVSVEVIDLVSVYPVDILTIQQSVAKTGRILVVDAATPGFSVSTEVLGCIADFGHNGAYSMTCQNWPCPTATSLTAGYYPTDRDIAAFIAEKTGRKYACAEPKTFAEMNLPPTENISLLVDKLEPVVV